jgi:hypothetical protein
MRFGAPSGQVLIFFDHEIAKDINRFFGFWEILYFVALTNTRFKTTEPLSITGSFRYHPVFSSKIIQKLWVLVRDYCSYRPRR